MFTLKFWYQMKAHFMLHDMSEIIFFLNSKLESCRVTSKIGLVKYNPNS